MNKKNVKIFIIHGWGLTNKDCWIPWLKSKLENKGYKVKALNMPNTLEPDLQEWLGALDKAAGIVDDECFFVGYSIGGITTLRFLAKKYLESGNIAGGIILVAAGTADYMHNNHIELSNFYNKPLDYGVVKKSANKFVGIYSTDDPHVNSIGASNFFKTELGAKNIFVENAWHFNRPGKYLKFPLLLDKLEEMIGKRNRR